MRKIIIMLLVCQMLLPLVNAEDNISLSDLITDKTYYNHGNKCNFQFNIRNNTDYNIQNVLVEIKVTNNGNGVSLASGNDSKYTTVAGAQSPNTQYKSFNIGSSGSYLIEVWIQKGSVEKEHITKSLTAYATDISIDTNKQTFSQYENENVEMHVTVTNLNSNSSDYTIELYLITPTGTAYAETNSSTIGSVSTKTITRSYKIKSTDSAGEWKFKAKAFPVGKSTAYAEKEITLTVELASYSLMFIPPDATKYNTPIFAYAKVVNSGTNPVYVDLGFAIFSTVGSGGTIVSGDLKNIQVQSTNSITKEQVVTMYLQQMASIQKDLPIGTYTLQLYGRIIGTPISASESYQLVIMENVPTSESSMLLLTQKPEVNQYVDVELVYTNKEFDRDIVIDYLEFYIENPAGRPVYYHEENNLKMTKKGTLSSSKTFNVRFKPSIEGTYRMKVRINRGSEKEVGTFNVFPGGALNVGVSNVRFNPSNTFTTAESVELVFDITNTGANPEAVDYTIVANSNTLVGLSGSEIVGGSIEKVEVKRIVTGSVFVAQQNIPIDIVVSGSFPEVKYPVTITVTNPSGQRSKIFSPRMDRTFYQVGTSGTLTMSIQNSESYAVTNYIVVNYPSDKSASGESRKIINLTGSETKLISIPIQMNTVQNGVGINVQLVGTHDEAVAQVETIRFDILSPSDYSEEGKTVRALNFWKGLSGSLFTFVGGAIVAIVLFLAYLKFGKKKKVSRDEEY